MPKGPSRPFQPLEVLHSLEVAIQPRDENHRARRFADEIVAAGRKGIFQPSVLADACYENNGRGLVFVHAAERAANFDAVHSRHFHVEQERVDVAALRHCNRPISAFRLEDFVVFGVQDFGQGLANSSVIIRDEDGLSV